MTDKQRALVIGNNNVIDRHRVIAMFYNSKLKELQLMLEYGLSFTIPVESDDADTTLKYYAEWLGKRND